MTAIAAGSGRGFLQSERQREILAQTLEEGRVEVADLAHAFQVTPETIRRDLSELQNQRLLQRVHGGAIPWQTRGFEPLLAVRNDQHVTEKRRIADRALQELVTGGTVIVDSGSTLTLFAERIPPDQSLRVVTNALLTAQVLAQNDAVEVVMLGGKVRKNTLAMVDPETVSSVADLRVDTLFISADGMSAQQGLTTPYREEATLKRAMISAAERVVALVDYSKYGKDHLVRFARWDDVDLLITDKRADPELVSQIEGAGTEVAVV